MLRCFWALKLRGDGHRCYCWPLIPFTCIPCTNAHRKHVVNLLFPLGGPLSDRNIIHVSAQTMFSIIHHRLPFLFSRVIFVYFIGNFHLFLSLFFFFSFLSFVCCGLPLLHPHPLAAAVTPATPALSAPVQGCDCAVERLKQRRG
jgi:hypothetical protein